MGLFDRFKGPSEEAQASARRQAEILDGLRNDEVPASIGARLAQSRQGRLPWVATLTPSELSMVRSHGLRPIASVSATCWMHYGWSWTEGHAQGWGTALRRLRDEARTAGANAVLDVKMRTIPLGVGESMDFTLIGTAVHVDGLPPSTQPVVATVPALEFVKLLEADVVPTGLAVGAQYDWFNDQFGSARQGWMGNIESRALSDFWSTVRRRAIGELTRSALAQGNGVLAHLEFGQSFRVEGENGQPTRYLGRYIIIGTTVDARRGVPFPHDVRMAIDLRDDATPLAGTRPHHQSYALNEEEGAI